MFYDKKTEMLISQLVTQYRYPNMVPIQQIFDPTHIEDIQEEVKKQLILPNIKMQMKKVKKGDTIAITVGSRQIANLPLIVKTLAEELKKIGACPFVVPAMGSHGGATAEGQKAIVESYGMSESYTGIPIKSTMETTNIGLTEDGRPTFIDAYAAKANYIIALNRIKPHTSFRGKYESGLMKILVIGLGKQRGAEICHNEGFGRMAYNIEMFGKSIITHAPILLGIGIVENAFDKTFKIEALTPQQIISEEPKLLSLAKEKMGKILFSSCDVLIVDQIGKNISGGGMDPNITGRFSTSYATGGIKAQTVTVLDMTKESHGSALGIGVAETTTQKLMDKTCLSYGYINCLTSLVIPNCRIPIVLPNDKEAIGGCLRLCTGIDRNNAKIIRIKDTLHLDKIQISTAMLDEAKKNPNIRILSNAKPMCFDRDGNLVKS